VSLEDTLICGVFNSRAMGLTTQFVVPEINPGTVIAVGGTNAGFGGTVVLLFSIFRMTE